MTTFLAIACAITALALFFSALTRVQTTRPTDPASPGPWGVLDRTSEPRRSLSAEERRWQTRLLKAADDEGTWREVSSHLAELERNLGGDPPLDFSPNFDRSQLHATIARLEALAEGESKTS